MTCDTLINKYLLTYLLTLSVFFIKLSTKAYLTGVCYDLNDTEGELRVR